eukprot:scaffold132_cov170-Amphora_coffeaeformis.AAC.61
MFNNSVSVMATIIIRDQRRRTTRKHARTPTGCFLWIFHVYLIYPILVLARAMVPGGGGADDNSIDSSFVPFLIHDYCRYQ